MDKTYLDQEGLERLVEYIQLQLKSRDNAINNLNIQVQNDNVLDGDIILYGGSASEVMPEGE